MAAVATAPRRETPAIFEPEPSRATLDARITALWTELVEHGAAECPVCGAETAAGARCRGCGSELS